MKIISPEISKFINIIFFFYQTLRIISLQTQLNMQKTSLRDINQTNIFHDTITF